MRLGWQRRQRRASRTFNGTLLEAATSASKPAWVEFERPDYGNRKRVAVPDPRRPCRVAAIELLLREGLGRPAQAEEPPSLPQLPRTEAEARALDWDQLKALVVADPELEYLPEGKRKQWLVSHWVGLTQTERTAFAPHSRRPMRRGAEHSVV